MTTDEQNEQLRAAALQAALDGDLDMAKKMAAIHKLVNKDTEADNK